MAEIKNKRFPLLSLNTLYGKVYEKVLIDGNLLNTSIIKV